MSLDIGCGGLFISGGGGGGAGPGGPDDSVQINDGAGGFAGFVGLTFDGTDLTLGNTINVSRDLRFFGFTSSHVIAGEDNPADGGSAVAMFYISGTGGASAAGVAGGGGTMSFTAGAGGDGNGATSTAGNGATVSIDAGPAGSIFTAGASPGIAGRFEIRSGTGSFAGGGNDGGPGGENNIRGGLGGSAFGGGNGGDGAPLNLRGGGGGNGATGGLGANCNIFGGGSTQGIDGNVTIASANTLRIDIGNVTDDPPTNFLGAGLVTFSDGSPVLPSSTVAGVPSASPLGQLRMITNEAAGIVPAYSDGTNWRRMSDDGIISA